MIPISRRSLLAASLTGLSGFPLAACSAETSVTELVTGEQAASTTTGLDAARMDQVVRSAAALPRLRSLVVMRHGEVQAQHRFNGGPALDRAVNIKSASKSVLSALIGIAIERGVFTGVDQTVLSVLARDAPANPDPRLSRLTIAHLLSMRAGLERTSGEYYGRWVSSANWVRYALSRPFIDEPGGRMIYSTGSSHLMSAMLTRASGRSTLVNAREWLGTPLGVEIPTWTRDPQGVFFGGNEMAMSPYALGKFGELYRNGGKVGERQVVPAAWVEDSWNPRTTSPWSGNRYGYGWFIAEARGHPVRFGWGYGGQMVYVIPTLQMTVVMTSEANAPREGDHIGALHRLLADGIVPAAEVGRAG